MCDEQEDLVEVRIREFRAIREARSRVVDEGDPELDEMALALGAPLFAPVQQVIKAIQQGQLLAYGSMLADKETDNE